MCSRDQGQRRQRRRRRPRRAQQQQRELPRGSHLNQAERQSGRLINEKGRDADLIGNLFGATKTITTTTTTTSETQTTGLDCGRPVQGYLNFCQTNFREAPEEGWPPQTHLLPTLVRKSPALSSLANHKQQQAAQPDLKLRNLVKRSPTLCRSISSLHANPQTRIKMSPKKSSDNKCSLPAAFVVCLLAAICCCCCLLFTSHQISCQTANFEGPAEGRGADSSSPLKPSQVQQFDQLVKLLSSYANQNQNQQSQQQPNILGIGQQNQRRPALPLNSAAAIQRGAALATPIQVSTPVNPFSLPQFQSSRRVNFPNQMNSNNNNNQPSMFVSSSPPTPYLTLNRIASMANQNNQNNQNQMRPFQVQPINTIPLGSQQNRGQMMPSPAPPQMRPGVQQQRPNQQQQFISQQQQQRQPMFSTPVPLPPSLLAGGQSQQANSVKPISGFAPSGPPPSLSASNAMVVVESPTNAIGQTVSPPTSQQQGSGTNSEQASRGQDSTTTVRPANEQADQESSPPTATSQQQDDNSRTTLQPATTLIASSQQPTESTTSAAAATSSSSPQTTTSSGGSDQDQNRDKETSTQWNPVELNRTAAATDSHQSTGSNNTRNKVTLLPSPDIVTVPPGYNPDSQANQPQSYDIAVSAQMPGSNSLSNVKPSNSAPTTSGQQQEGETTSSSSSPPPPVASPATDSTGAGEKPQAGRSKDHSAADSSPASTTILLAENMAQSTPTLPPIAPTAVTTIIWSPNDGLPSAPSTATAMPIRPTLSAAVNSKQLVQPTRVINGEQRGPLTSSAVYSPASRIKDNSMLNNNNNQQDEQQQKQAKFGDKQQDGNPQAGVVYGKAPAKEAKPTPPNSLVSPAPVLSQASFESQVPGAGRPFVQPVQMDNQVHPYSARAQQHQHQRDNGGQQQPAILKSNHHGHSSSSVPFRSSKPLNQGLPGMSIGSAFTISGSGNQTMPTGDIQDYVAGQPPLLAGSSSTSQSGSAQPGQQATGAFHVTGDNPHEPTISAHGGQDPASFDLSSSPDRHHSHQAAGSGGNAASSNKASQQGATGSANSSSSDPPTHLVTPRIRRPTFKPKPAVPPIRIDSCIVGDDSSCDQSHNERCVTEYGISSCHCKPGFARLSQLRGYCSPISSLQLSMKIDRLSDDRRLVYNQTLDNSNTEEYQYLEFETIQALASAFQQTSLAKQFMGARVNKFFERKGKVWANLSVNFESNEISKTDKILTLAAQELQKVVQGKAQKPLGDSTVVVDGSKETISRLVDVNECSSRELNDCSKFASCTNDFGGFHCQCLPGYEDKYQSEERDKHGRVCLGCSPSFCSNRGECSINDGQKQCKCRPNFIGARCDIDSEVLAVAVGGSLVGIIILVITFWCLYVFNRRWKREQQKMDAMSATSGLTFNYVNSSTNSLMSPTSSRVVGGLQSRSAVNGHQVGAIAANYGQRFGAALVNGTSRVGVGQQHYAADQQAIIGSTSSGSSAASQPIACNPYATNQYQYEDAGLLIAPASTGSSEQTSPSGQSYRGITMAGNAYTLSGHHHHHHHNHHPGNLMQSHKQVQPQITQFHPAADFRAMQPQCTTTTAAAYDHRWRTMQQQDHNKHQTSTLIGYYLSPDMLVNQQQNQIQQLYASPQRELCIDTGGHNNNRSRKQQGRANQAAAYGHTMRSRSQSQHNLARNSMYHNSSDYDHERPI